MPVLFNGAIYFAKKMIALYCNHSKYRQIVFVFVWMLCYIYGNSMCGMKKIRGDLGEKTYFVFLHGLLYHIICCLH